MLDIILRYSPGLVAGIRTTLELWFIIALAGLVIGTFVGWDAARSGCLGWIEVIGRWLVSVVPALVLIMWIYYPFQALLRVEIPPFWSCALALGILNASSVAVAIRSSWNSIPIEIRLLGPMYGATRKTTFFLVEAPILLRLSLPALLTIQIAMLHATLLGSFIGVDEILKVTGRINAIEYQPIELYTILAAIFVLLCIPLTIVAGWLARKYRIAGV